MHSILILYVIKVSIIIKIWSTVYVTNRCHTSFNVSSFYCKIDKNRDFSSHNNNNRKRETESVLSQLHITYM